MWLLGTELGPLQEHLIWEHCLFLSFDLLGEKPFMATYDKGFLKFSLWCLSTDDKAIFIYGGKMHPSFCCKGNVWRQRGSGPNSSLCFSLPRTSGLIAGDERAQSCGRDRGQGHHTSVETCILAGLTLSEFQEPAEHDQDKLQSVF